MLVQQVWIGWKAGQFRHSTKLFLGKIVFYICDLATTLAMQIIWALGNIAADSRDMQKAVLEEGVLEPVLSCMKAAVAAVAATSAAAVDPSRTEGGGGRGIKEDRGPLALFRQAAWLLSNLCRPRPQDDKIYVRSTGPETSMFGTFQQNHYFAHAITWCHVRPDILTCNLSVTPHSPSGCGSGS